ncbi:WbqC family protein [Puia dinghuensis]|uniref:WbqC-like protein n=1 Tax=Puia dinghuensis TaxID=1792502 RepID=A0A8J2XU84_9BACT|nr:WbqC family protein [Puia dinghuensis]GGB08612.1 hypothetical protein GCM10011511_35130 [Puia dinghuensis]
MRLAIMQPYIFPYIGYYQLINAVERFVIYDDVNFINRGWINRNNILVNNKACLFTIPLKDASQNRLIRDIELSAGAGNAKLLKTIEQAYKKAPEFRQVYPLISDILQSNAGTIGELAWLSLRSVAEYLGMATEFIRTSSDYNNSHLKAQERILDICTKEKAHHYINPIGGMEIYSRELFQDSGIKLNFIRTLPLAYPQFNNEFISNLSIIDVLMFNPKDKINALLNSYELI